MRDFVCATSAVYSGIMLMMILLLVVAGFALPVFAEGIPGVPQDLSSFSAAPISLVLLYLLRDGSNRQSAAEVRHTEQVALLRKDFQHELEKSRELARLYFDSYRDLAEEMIRGGQANGVG